MNLKENPLAMKSGDKLPDQCPICQKWYKANIPKRICCKCNKQICRRDKWRFNSDHMIEHRNCDNPENYT